MRCRKITECTEKILQSRTLLHYFFHSPRTFRTLLEHLRLIFSPSTSGGCLLSTHTKSPHTTESTLIHHNSYSTPFNTILMPPEQQACLVCYDDDVPMTLTPCGHNGTCGVCHFRLRQLHNDQSCPICKKTNEQVVVVDPNDTEKSFADYSIWGDDLGPNFHYHEPAGMFFPISYFETDIRPLLGYPCGTCDFDGATTALTTNKPPLRALQDHLRVQHRQALCQLCVDHHRDFVARLTRHSPSQLQQHLAEQHALCQFCRPKRFYDLTALHQHLNRDHYKCHVCEKQDDLPNQFFRDYKSLERHFDRFHFLCNDVQCLQARFVVFGSELDLVHHERHVHGGVSSAHKKIQLDFKVRRSQEAPPSAQDFDYDLDGQAFVPAALPTTSNDTALHPAHVARTQALQAHAASLRPTTEQFPTLAAAAPTNNLRVGWTGKLKTQSAPVGTVTNEDFPSLVAPQRHRTVTQTRKKAPTLNKKNWSQPVHAAQAQAMLVPPAQLSAANFPSLVTSSRAATAPISSGSGRSAAAVARPGSRTTMATTTVPPNTAANFPSLATASNDYETARAYHRKQQSVRDKLVGTSLQKKPSKAPPNAWKASR